MRIASSMETMRDSPPSRRSALAHVSGVQVALQGFSGGEALEEALLLLRVVGGAGADGLEALLQPALLGVIAHVHVFDADRAAVGLLRASTRSPSLAFPGCP